jgi:hypothetical protein
LAARRAQGGADEAVAGEETGAALGVVGTGSLNPRDRAGDGDVPPECDAVLELDRRRQAATSQALGALPFCRRARGDLARPGAWRELQGDRASDRAPAHDRLPRGKAPRRSTPLPRPLSRGGGVAARAAPKALKACGKRTSAGVVCEKLRRNWSPEQISAWLRRAYSDDPGMQVSHETIYLSLFIQSRGALRRELCDHLRSGRRLRRPPAQRAKRQGQGQIPNKVMISERPAEASDRAVPGHWEGDLLLGRRPSGIATLVERSTRYLQLLALPDGHGAEAVRDALMRSIGQLPEQLRRSLTWDQGKECSSTFSSRSTQASRSTSAIPAAHGSGARTRTPTASCASTSPRSHRLREPSRPPSIASGRPGLVRVDALRPFANGRSPLDWAGPTNSRRAAGRKYRPPSPRTGPSSTCAVGSWPRSAASSG